MKKIYIVVGSSRPHWLGRQIAKWVLSLVHARSSVKLEIIDLEDVYIPHELQQKDADYLRGHRRPKTITNADGIIFITPEYAEEYSRQLRQTLDYVYDKWANTPVAFVSYGQFGGVGIVTKLQSIVRRRKMLPIQQAVHIEQPWLEMDERGYFINEEYEKSAVSMIDTLLSAMRNPQLLAA